MRYYGMSSQGGKRLGNMPTEKFADSAIKVNAENFLNPNLRNNEYEKQADSINDAAQITIENSATEAEDAATLHAEQQAKSSAMHRETENAQSNDESLSSWLKNQPKAIFPPHKSSINIKLPQNVSEIGAGVGIGNSGDGAIQESNYPLNGNGYYDSREKNDYINTEENIGIGNSSQRISAARVCPMREKNYEYLCRATGQFVKVEFCCGNPVAEKSGTLKYVGSDYIVLEESGSRNSVMCATKNINSVTVYA